MVSIKQCLEVLRLVAGSDRPLGASDIAKRMGLHRSSAYRICQTLVSEGFLQQDPEDKKYTIGSAAFELGQAYMGVREWTESATEIVKNLLPEFTWYVGVLSGCDILLLVVYEGTGPVRVTARAGETRKAHATSLGKVLLAHLSEAELETYLNTYDLVPVTKHTITDPAVLHGHLERIREDGYACSSEESMLGVTSIGCPIRDGSGRVVAGVSMSMLSNVFEAMDEAKRAEILKAVATASREIGHLPYFRRGGRGMPSDRSGFQTRL